MKSNRKIILNGIEFRLNLILFISFVVIAAALFIAFSLSIEDLGWIVGLVFVALFMPFIIYYLIRIINILKNINNIIVETDYVETTGFGAFFGIKVRFIDDNGITKDLVTPNRIYGAGLARVAQGKRIKVAYLKDSNTAIIINISD